MKPPNGPVGLPALVGSTPQILILGSLPSVISLERGEYYANPRNQFWRIVAQIFGFTPNLNYAARATALTSCRVALWDVCQSARRIGSLDAAIDARSVIPNDIVGLLSQYPSVKHVYINGLKAATLLDRLNQGHDLLTTRTVLPSTSPAHAAMSMSDKASRWNVIGRAAY